MLVYGENLERFLQEWVERTVNVLALLKKSLSETDLKSDLRSHIAGYVVEGLRTKIEQELKQATYRKFGFTGNDQGSKPITVKCVARWLCHSARSSLFCVSDSISRLRFSCLEVASIMDCLSMLWIPWVRNSSPKIVR